MTDGPQWEAAAWAGGSLSWGLDGAGGPLAVRATLLRALLP